MGCRGSAIERKRAHLHPGHAEAHLHHGASELALGDGAIAARVPVIPLSEEVGKARCVLHERITQLLALLQDEGGEGGDQRGGQEVGER